MQRSCFSCVRFYSASVFLGSLTILVLAAAPAWAAEPKIQTVLSGLRHPTSLALQPDTNVLFFVEASTRRVVRVVDKKSEPVIANVPPEVALAFFDKNTLIVADSGTRATEDAVVTFQIPAAGESLDFVNDVKGKFGPLTKVEGQTSEKASPGIAVTPQAIFSGRSGIHRIEVNGTKFGALERFIASDNVQAITNSPRGELVAALGKQTNESSQVSLSFFRATSGKKLLSLDISPRRLRGMAYHPQTGLLYAIDDKGLWRIDRTRKGNTSAANFVEVLPRAHATSLAFRADGVLFITTAGSPADEASGELLSISLSQE